MNESTVQQQSGMDALLIPADLAESIRVVEQHGLDDLQRLVGGYIEGLPVRGREDVMAYIHGEGKFVPDHAVNLRATALLARSIVPGDYVAGACVLVGIDPKTGADLPVPADFAEAVQASEGTEG